MADRFSYFTHNLVTRDRIDEPPILTGSYRTVLNERGTRFDLTPPLVHRSSTFDTWEPEATMVAVDRAGTLDFCGVVHDDIVTVDANTYGWRVGGEGLWSYYGRRTVRSRQGMSEATGTAPIEAIWTNVDQFLIVQDLIDHAADIAGAANVGFDDVRYFGPGVGGLSGVTRSKVVYGYERKTIDSLVTELAAQTGGFDFGVNVEWDYTTSPPTPLRYLDLYYPRRGLADSEIVLEHGTNVSVLNLTRSGTDMANPLVGVGSGNADAQLTIEVTDGSYLYPTGSYPYLEGAVDYRDWGVEYAGNLSRYTAANLSRTRAPVTTARVRVREEGGLRLGDVGLGDTVRFSAHVQQFEHDEDLRVMSIAVDTGPTGLTGWEIELAPEDATLGL